MSAWFRAQVRAAEISTPVVQMHVDDRVDHRARHAPPHHQSLTKQHLQMLRHDRRLEFERGGNASNRKLCSRQHVDDSDPRLVRQCTRTTGDAHGVCM